MKPVARFLAFLLLTISPLPASELMLQSTKQPIFLTGSDEDRAIRFADVPYVTMWAAPEWKFSAISQPFIPATDPSWQSPHDVNLVSLYGIKVSGTSTPAPGPDKWTMIVTIDASNAKVPEHYPFTIEQIIDAATTCVKLVYPPEPGKTPLEIKIIPPVPETK